MKIEINDFSGPLDLLLQLIKSNKMDIYDIDIEVITKKYIDYITTNKELTIDSSSEYLVMASELIHLKSKLLLNSQVEDDLEYEINNEEELRNRLLEYQKIKELADDFKLLEEKRMDIYTKLPTNLKEFNEDNKLSGNMNIDILTKAFEEFLKRQKMHKPLTATVTKRELNIKERITEIRNILKLNKRVNFYDLFDQKNREYLILTFLSILDMTKNQEIKIIQKHNFDDITIEGI